MALFCDKYAAILTGKGRDSDAFTKNLMLKAAIHEHRDAAPKMATASLAFYGISQGS